MQLWTEEVESEVLGTLTPSGALRNLALQLADTEVNHPRSCLGSP